MLARKKKKKRTRRLPSPRGRQRVRLSPLLIGRYPRLPSSPPAKKKVTTKKKKKSQKYCKTNNGFPCVWCVKRKKAREKGDNSRNEFYEAMCEDGFKKIKERYEK